MNLLDQHHRSPLHMAAFSGKASAVAKLLEKGADPQVQALEALTASVAARRPWTASWRCISLPSRAMWRS